MSLDIGLGALGAGIAVAAAIIKIPPLFKSSGRNGTTSLNGLVTKEVCQAQHKALERWMEGLSKEVAETRSAVSRLTETILDNRGRTR